MSKEYLDKLISTIMSVDNEGQRNAALQSIDTVLGMNDYTARDVLYCLLSKSLERCQEK